jgi:type III restriction enzyme
VLKLKPEFEQFRPRITDIIKNHLLKNRIENTKEKKQKILNKEIYLSEDFKELWNRISQKTLYSVDYKSNELIKNVIIRFKDEPRILPPKIKTSTSVVSIDKKGVNATVIREESKEYQDNYYIPNILTLIDKELEYKITKNTISEIIIKSGRIEELKINPQEFMRQLTKVIKNELNKIIVQGIKYEKIENEYYLMQKFHEDDLKDYLISKAIESKKHIFNIVEYDSETEKTFAQSLNNREDIILFTKLPGWFIVKTPLGDYNPDWAIVKQETNGEKLYLVKETKGSLDYAQLRSIEDQKIQCGKKHFESIGVDFGVASNANQI